MNRIEFNCETGEVSTVALSQAEIDALPVESLDDAKSFQLSLIERAYDVARQASIAAYMGTSFQADDNSQSLMSRTIIGLQAIVATRGTIPADFGWFDVNNVKMPMTLVQLQGLYATGMASINAAFTHKQAQKAAIRAATTVSAVTAIAW